MAVWYGASNLTREAFRQPPLDPSMSDDIVDRLRSAAKGIVHARNHAQLGAAGEDLATAAQTIGPDRWPRFIGDTERCGMAAVSDGVIPGVVKASATGTETVVGATVGLELVLLMLALKNQGAGSARPTTSPMTPSRMPVERPKDDGAGGNPTASSTAPGATPPIF